MLVKYIRDKGTLVGCIVAVGRDQIGVSMCYPKSATSPNQDKFTKERAFDIAKGRAEVNGVNPGLNRKFRAEYKIMADRAAKYFKPEYVAPSLIESLNRLIGW